MVITLAWKDIETIYLPALSLHCVSIHYFIIELVYNHVLTFKLYTIIHQVITVICVLRMGQ